MPKIYVVTGPPGAGKTSLCMALAQRGEFGLHIPVDDLRLWVKQGLSDSIPWTDETERQFQLAERSAAKVAAVYGRAGFVVAIDHCRNLRRLDEFIESELAELEVVRILLLPSLDENLERNRTRVNKDFDPEVLKDTIRFTNEQFRNQPQTGWTVIDNTRLTIEQTLAAIPI